MSENPVFIELLFFSLLIFSIILPICIYGYLMWKKSISRVTVLILGLILIVISGIDLFLLRHLTGMSEESRVFASEFSVAL